MMKPTIFISDNQLIFFAADIGAHWNAVKFLIFVVELQPLVRRNRYSIDGQK